MRMQTVKREARLREWAAQISECRGSGMNVSRWCEKNGIGRNAYYYHLKAVREEIPEQAELAGCDRNTHGRGIEFGTRLAPTRANIPMSQRDDETSLGQLYGVDVCHPVFTELSMTSVLKPTVTMRTGRVAVEIANGADAALVEQVVRLAAMI